MAKKAAPSDSPASTPEAAPATPAAEAKPKKGKPAAESTPAEAPQGSTEARPAAASETPSRKRKPGVPPRRGKKLRNTVNNTRQKAAKEGAVPLRRAIQLVKQLKRAKFDETVEVHMSLGIDPTQSEQMIRGAVALPHGVGKAKRVVVFTQGENVAKAKEAGADFAGSADLIEKIQKENWLDFDVALATQDMMGQVSRLGKVLGPRGLMPTPKAGTVVSPTGDLAATVREFKAGKVEYRTDKGGNVHAGVGKMSFDEDKLAANVTTFVEQIRSVKPAGVKGHYIRSITLAGTMTPGVTVTM